MAREFYEQGATVVAVDLCGPAAEETIALLKDPDRGLALTAYVSRLASDDADFIHGAAFTIDGGWLLP